MNTVCKYWLLYDTRFCLFYETHRNSLHPLFVSFSSKTHWLVISDQKRRINYSLFLLTWFHVKKLHLYLKSNVIERQHSTLNVFFCAEHMLHATPPLKLIHTDSTPTCSYTFTAVSSTETMASAASIKGGWCLPIVLSIPIHYYFYQRTIIIFCWQQNKLCYTGMPRWQRRW